MKRYLVTSALPYANGPVHIGHLAGAYLPADIYVRYLRLKGEDVLYICGSDEHGVPITLRARKEGIAPQQVVDKYHNIIKKSFEEFGISFDIYHRTSEKLHHETAQEFFTTLYEKKVLVEEESEQYYDEEAKMFLADRYITGTCPNCKNENAYGDQCERCGKSLSPRELINPHSQLSGKAPVLKKTKHWYLPLDKMQEEWIQDWIESKKGVWKTNVYGQCKSWLDQGLQPRAVTRDLDWGVKVPLPGTEGKVLYVWFDAPIGYISATKAYFEEVGSLQKAVGKGSTWETYWKDKDTRLIHFIGKDNIVFHCIIFPAMLNAHGEFILPENIPANEFLNLEGEKISTSRNWAVWLDEYLKDFPDKKDELRYVLTSIAPETKDSEFTWKDFQARVNNELVAIFGNFVNRVVTLTRNYFDGSIELDKSQMFIYEGEIIRLTKAYQTSIEKFAFREALSFVIDMSRIGNKYLTDNEPWKKFDKNNLDSIQHTKAILFNCLELIGRIAVYAQVFLPQTSKKIFKLLGLSDEISFSFNIDKTIDRKNLIPNIIFQELNVKLSKEQFLLFEKIEDEEMEKQIQKLNATKNMNEPQAEISNSQSAIPSKPEIIFDDFEKMDIRVGTILEAEKVEGTDKLLKLKVDTGIDQRTVVSGIALFYKPEEIIGRQVSILVNLQPRKIKGILSQGMILMAENSKGELAFVSPEKNSENGSTIK
ncbi:MAG TPA: methionine--tRNA ligase [Bacteroidia bacterium]|nr:methionine--tRNA ligase [Bacteroidia bacterium]